MDKLIVTNFKMNLSKEEVLEYKKIVENSDIKNLIISPSNIYLDLMSSNKYDLCAQNGYYEDFGTHTGEVSFKQLKSLGVKYSLIGHSETRNMSNEDIPLKLKSCINNGIVPILCVGNDINEKDTSKLFCILDKELKVLSGLKINDAVNIIKDAVCDDESDVYGQLNADIIYESLQNLAHDGNESCDYHQLYDDTYAVGDGLA